MPETCASLAGILEFIKAHWPSGLDAAFLLAVIGSGAGAFGGALGAQKIVERTAARKELREQINAVNSATSVCFQITNTLINLKGTLLLPLKENFDRTKTECIAAYEAFKAGEVRFHEFVADLQTLTIPTLPIETLNRLVLEKLELVGRPLVLAPLLAQTLHDIAGLCTARNELISEIKAAKYPNGVPPYLYFGLPDPEGHRDERYSSCVAGLYSLNDSAIWFGQRICVDLVAYVINLQEQFKASYRGPVPKTAKPDFGMAKAAGLIPSDDDFGPWLENFPETDAKRKP